MKQSQSLITKILMTDDYNDLRVQQEEREKAGGELQKIWQTSHKFLWPH